MDKYGFSFSLIKNQKEGVGEFLFNWKNYSAHAFYKSHFKFREDKVFSNQESYFLLFDGYVLNKKDILKTVNKESWEKTIIELYQLKGSQFYDNFEGAFSGILFDKISGELLFFTDHIAQKPVLYSANSSGIIVTSNIGFISDSKINLTLNESSAYYLLSFGFLIDENTLVNEVKRLLPGSFALWKNSQLKTKKYYQFKKNIKPIQMNEAIEEVDSLFTELVSLGFKKDQEAGYSHFSTLSGGLDSRMVNFIAKKKGCKEILALTFGQTGSLDVKIASQIAQDLYLDWIFRALDNGKYLIDTSETITELTSGLALSAGPAHCYASMKNLNLDNYGLMHTGQLGDVVLGYFPKGTKDFKLYSHALFHKIENEAKKIRSCFEDQELFLYYTRAFQGTNVGLYAPQAEFTEVYSPFMHIKFCELCLSIPQNLRKNHLLYFKWICKKHPNAAKYIYENLGTKISALKFNIFGKTIPYRQFFPKLWAKFVSNKKGLRTGMNPFDLWYQNNPFLKESVERAWDCSVDIRHSLSSELRKDLEVLYSNNGFIEKNMALSLLSAIRCFSINPK